MFAACAQFDTALEINCRPERQDPPDELLTLAVDWGLRFASTPTPTPRASWSGRPTAATRRPATASSPSSIVNTMAADDLLAWAGSHAA